MQYCLNLETVAPVIDRLESEAAESAARLGAELGRLTPEDRSALMAGAQTDYRAFYGLARDYHLAVDQRTASLLYLLGRARGARRVVEFGTSFGYSTIHLAAAVYDNGGGIVIGSEFEPQKAARARENLAAAGLLKGVEIREDDALQSLSRDLPDGIELVLMDGAKTLYPRILSLLRPHLAPAAVIVADNANDSPEYLAIVRDPANGFHSVSLSSELELTISL